MGIGCMIPLGIWSQQHWLMQMFLSSFIFANFFIAYKLRDM